MQKLGSCGCERDGVGRREVGNDAQDAGGVVPPLTEVESIRGGASWGEDSNYVERSGELPELGLGRSEGHGHLGHLDGG